MKQKIYILTTFCHYEQTDERAIWSEAYPTRKAAEKAMREKIKEDTDAYCEGADIIERWTDYLRIIRSAIEKGGEEHDAVIDWFADRFYIYDIFPDTIEIKEG